MIAVAAGLLGLAILAVFVSAIPISYAIEARSDPKRFANRKFGYTNIWAVTLGIGVASDAETRALRRKLLKRMAAIAVMFLGLAALAAFAFDGLPHAAL